MLLLTLTGCYKAEEAKEGIGKAKEAIEQKATEFKEKADQKASELAKTAKKKIGVKEGKDLEKREN
jgi:hypothetical protein